MQEVSLLHKSCDSSDREENCGEELNQEGIYQYQCDAVLNKYGNFLSKTLLNFRQNCKQ